MPLWVYHVADGVFLRDRGTEPLLAGEAEVSLTDTPHADERYDAAAPTKRRPATAPEVTAVLDAQKDAEIDNLKAFQALAKATFELKTTAYTLATFSARIKTIYRGL